MRLKYAFLLSIFCVIILSCTDKKPVSQAQAASVQQEDSVPVKKVDSVKVAKKTPLTYKILVPFAYRFCNPDTLINKNWVELYKDGKNYYVGKAHYSIQKKEDECVGGMTPHLSGETKYNLIRQSVACQSGEGKDC